MTVTERVAYIRGLIEGLELDEASKEARVIKAMVEVLDDLALSVEDLEDSVEDLSEQVDTIDEDLTTLEEDFYSSSDDDDDDDEGELYEVTCPSCGEAICVDEDMLDKGEMTCPSCGEQLEFDLDLDGCCCDDECGCEYLCSRTSG